MSDESSEPNGNPSRTANRLQTYSERAGVVWDLAKKCTLVFGVLFVIGLAVHDVVRECLDDRITLDPVVVKVPASDAAPTPEMVAQQTVNYMNFMRGTGQANGGVPISASINIRRRRSSMSRFPAPRSISKRSSAKSPACSQPDGEL